MTESVSYDSRVSDLDDQPFAEYRESWACDNCGIIQYLTADDEPYCPCVESYEN